MPRNLVAILVADIVGFSRLMQADEAGTLARWIELRDRVLVAEVRRHNGQTRRRAGDGILAVFHSVTKAANAALAIQKSSNRGDLSLRIGLHLGDVVVEGDTVHGHDVNLAVRIEAEAPIGGIAMSRAVHDAIRGQITEQITPLGRRRVKNIRHRVELFAIGAPPLWRRKTAQIGVICAASLMLIFAGVLGDRGLAGYLSFAPKPVTSVPKIAVFPFRPLGTLSPDDFVGRALPLEILTALSDNGSVKILSAETSFQFRDMAGGTAIMHKDLGVRYLITGRYHRQNGQMQVFVETVDLSNGQSLWTRQFQGQAADLAPIQNSVVQAIISVVAPIGQGDGHLLDAELERIKGIDPAAWNAFDFLVQGNRRLADGDYGGARMDYNRALERDPHFAQASARIAWSHIDAFRQADPQPGSDTLLQAVDAAKHATELDPQEPAAYRNLGIAQTLLKQPRQGIKNLRLALQLDHDAPDQMMWLAWALAHQGKTEEAMTLIQDALARDPHPKPWYHGHRAWAAYMARDCDEVIATLRPVQPKSPQDYLLLAACFGQLGQIQDALTMTEAFRRIRPEIGVGTLADRIPFSDARQRAEFVAQLRVAGLHDVVWSPDRNNGRRAP